MLIKTKVWSSLVAGAGLSGKKVRKKNFGSLPIVLYC